VDSSKEDPVEKIKALTDGRGVDAVILAVSTSKAYDQAFEMLKKPYGRMLLFAAGYPTTEVRIDANMFHYKKLELIGSYGAEQSDFFDAADLLNQKLINVKPLTRYGGKYSLSEIQKAFEVATVPGSFRVTVDLD
jgi:L-iditol 2-dehydrogenase